jgi:hypothetical protein
LLLFGCNPCIPREIAGAEPDDWESEVR